MPLLQLRDLLPYPSGDNATDTVINGVHFNRTALDHYNYTIYDNGTISNKSRCYLIFGKYQPTMLSNGSWINGTSCYVPYYGIHTRGKVGIAFATLFTVSIMFTLINLRKHGRQFLREEKRFRIVGRRWQWYWMLFAAACGLISTITGIDVDRNYLTSIAIVLQCFFFTLMLPASLAMVWEATRHWGSWQERQICDRDPFLLPEDDRRGKTEFYLPLIFYFFAWLDFFMTIPRSWTNIEYQRSDWQQAHFAEKTATDGRFKAGSIIAVIAWGITIYSLHHSLHHYRPRPATPSVLARINSFCLHCPTKLFLAILILGFRLVYDIAAAWVWDVSLLNKDVKPAWPYGLGYAPIVLLIIVFNIAGYVDENEDKLLIEQRRARDHAADADLGIVKKPSWWRKYNGGVHLSPEQRLRALAQEGPGLTTTTTTTTPPSANVELGPVSNAAAGAHQNGSGGSTVRNRSRGRDNADERNPFRDPSPDAAARRQGSRENGDGNGGGDGASVISGTTLGIESVPAQRVRSMLDV
ncbi:uncharacterized protein IWZ02DRAFT_430417 [Phyllosticta citriasiana]|uniref:uncharacterized protein n=1 Tax=Phyllosticta citriasiana TaxID=595635 RepID=UPI0030FD7C0F